MNTTIRRWVGTVTVILLAEVIPNFADAQWWGTDALPGNSNMYTYRTRLGTWQYGTDQRNVTTPPRFGDSGIVRDVSDGSIVAVNRNIQGGRFAWEGTPAFTFVPRRGFYDRGYGYWNNGMFFEYRSGVRQFWPETGRILLDDYEQSVYVSDSLPDVQVSATSVPETSAVPKQLPRRVPAVVVIQKNRQAQKTPRDLQAPHDSRIATDRTAFSPRVHEPTQQMPNADAISQMSPRPEMSPQESSQWFRESLNPPPSGVIFSGDNFNISRRPVTFIIPENVSGNMPGNPNADMERNLEFALVSRPEITFLSPLRIRFDHGTVTVGGMVASEKERQIATEILSRQPGVYHVLNQIQYKP
ncbi:MAG: BON domain-containing protein [Planctomycetaceae bacterium]|nr:BON domain-containing protein [Planctomycetaceae bacterium]